MKFAHPKVVFRFYKRPFLTEAHFTAKHGLQAMSGSGISIGGTCTVDLPWGGQCTRLLKDGTPVEWLSFPYAVMAHLAGDADAMKNYLAKWNERILSLCEEEERRARKAAA